MEKSYIDAATFIIAYVLFGFAGYKYSQRLKQPVIIQKWLIYIAAAILAGAIGTKIRIFSVFNFGIYFSRTLLSFFIGILIRFVVRFVKEKRVKNNNNAVV